MSSGQRETIKDRFVDELRIEVRQLLSHWWILLIGIASQYVHGAATAVAYHLHEPRDTLKDLGFMLLPELPEKFDWLSESVFWTLFISFIVFSFTPFLRRRPTFYTVVLYSRFLCILSTCQALRVVSFLSTALPGPAYHCRPGQITARLAWPQHWYQNLVFDIGKQAAHSCGDLLFSSHTTFLLNGALTYSVYGGRRAIKAAVWLAVACICALIIASRKHYTVDVTVAWYVVPLVFFTWKRFWKTHRTQDDQGASWEPVKGGSPRADNADDELSDIVVTSNGRSSPAVIQLTDKRTADMRPPLKLVAQRWQPGASESDSAALLYQNSGPHSDGSRSGGSPGSNGRCYTIDARASSNGDALPARLMKMISSPPPERNDVESEGSSTSMQPRGGAMFNRSQGPASTGMSRRYSQADELFLAGEDSSGDGMKPVPLA